MNFLNYFLPLCCLFLSFGLAAQTSPAYLSCGYNELSEQPGESNRKELLESNYRDAILTEYLLPFSPRSSPPPYVLPVVVHLIHNSGEENLSEARVLQSIEWLNESFANAAYYDQQTGQNSQIQFCLARQTPDNEETNGITYHQDALTEVNGIEDDLPLKNLARWDPTRYVNIYVVKEICLSTCGVAGYAYYPAAHGLSIDGIVIEARWLGLDPANNAVLTHEMGHYLGLAHTFDNGCVNDDCLSDGDRVCDTPPDQSTVPVPCDGTANSCTTDTDSGFASDQNDMFNNYMDYGNLSCYNAFTQGQTDRMHFFIEGVRSSLLESPGCADPCPALVEAAFSTSPPGPNFDLGQTVQFINESSNGDDFQWLVDGEPVANTLDFSLLLDEPGEYLVTLAVASDNPDCFGDQSSQTVFASCNLSAEFTTDDQEVELGDEVNFTAEENTADTYSWTVNGNPQSNNSSLNYTFDTVDGYQICLTVSNDYCDRTTCSFYFIVAPDIPTVCTNSTGISAYGYNQGQVISAGPIIANDLEDSWQLLRIEEQLIFQRTDAQGAFSGLFAFNILNDDFIRFSDVVQMSNGNLLVGYVEANGPQAKRSYYLRFDPAIGALTYYREIDGDLALNDFVEIPGGTPDDYLFLCDLTTATGATEGWVFDVNGLSGESPGNWNYRSDRAAYTSFQSGVFDGNEFLLTGTFGATAVEDATVSGLARFSGPNNLADLLLYQNETNEEVDLRGRDLVVLDERTIVLHNGTPAPGSNESAYLSSWTDDSPDWLREYSVSGSSSTKLNALRPIGNQLYLSGSYEQGGEEWFFVMSTDAQGSVNWANRYDSDAGNLRPVSSQNGNLDFANNRLYLSAGLTGDSNAVALLTLNLDGTAEDPCVEIVPVGIQENLLATTVTSLTVNSVGQSFDFTDLPAPPISILNFPRYTGCVEICETEEEVCHVTGDQFVQMWRLQANDLGMRSDWTINDPAGGIIVVGYYEEKIYIHRAETDGIPLNTYVLRQSVAEHHILELPSIELTSNSKLLITASAFPLSNPGGLETQFISFDLLLNQTDWWRSLDAPARAVGIHQFGQTDDFVLVSQLFSDDPDYPDRSLSVQRRSLLTGELTGELDEKYYFEEASGHFYGSELREDILYVHNSFPHQEQATSVSAGVTAISIENGTEIFSRTVDDPAVLNQPGSIAKSLAQDAEELFFLYQTTDNSFSVVKFGTDGNLLWHRRYAGSGLVNIDLNQIRLTENDLIISGLFDPQANAGQLLVRLRRTNGNLLNARYFATTNVGEISRIARHHDAHLPADDADLLLGGNLNFSVTPVLGNYLIKASADGELIDENCSVGLDFTFSIEPEPDWFEVNIQRYDRTVSDQVYEVVDDSTSIDLRNLCFELCLVNPYEICGNGVDDDQNGLVDCDDPALVQSCCCLEIPELELPVDTAICLNQPLVIRPELSDTTGIFYRWSDGSTADTLTASEPGSYGLTITRGCGEMTSDEIMIAAIPLPEPPDLGPDVATCDNGVLTLSVNGIYDSYLWSDFTTDTTTTFFDPGDHWLRVTDVCGNVYSDTINLATLPATIIELPDTITLCPQDSQIIAVSGFSNYSWFPTEALDCDNCTSITAYPPPTGDTLVYTVLASTEDGCYSTDSVAIVGLVPGSSTTNATICSGEAYDFDGTLFAQTGQYLLPALCEGTDTLNLTVLPTPLVTELEQTICAGDSTLVFGVFRSQPGIYEQLLMAENGCDSLSVFTLTVTENPSVEIMVLDDECGLNTASVELTVFPAELPVEWNDPSLVGRSLELPTGIYPFSLTGDLACRLDTFVRVDLPVNFSLLLPPDTVIRLGETLLLNSRIFGTDPNRLNYQWLPTAGLSCDTCLNPIVTPFESRTYTLLATDDRGCVRSESLRIFVDERPRVYVPSAFSPNDDGVNDSFFPNCGPEVVTIASFRIFGRWGELVYDRADFAPNDPGFGWDGTVNGKVSSPGVFVWQMRFQLVDGSMLALSGDVTLIR